jgi:4-carboxymuconolactone decarboxylase
VDFTDRLRRLAINDASVADERLDEVGVGCGHLDFKAVALVRLAALVAVGGTFPSYGAYADAAVGAGVTAEEIVDVLFGVIPVVGLPRVVAAAPELALALGYNFHNALEP